MNKRKKRTVTLLLVVLLCMVSTCVLAIIAFVRSQQVQQQVQVVGTDNVQVVSNVDDIFWSGDETLLTRGDIVVFDMRYTDEDEEILISLAESIEESIQKKGIQPIFLGAETDSDLRGYLLKSEEIDIYIGLCVGMDQANAETFGTKCYYNEGYYVPDYNNVWLSDRLLQNVVTKISGRALGMEVCNDRDILVGLNIPAALLQIGYLTNEKEGAMLWEQKYLEKIASGIVETVEEYYEGE